MYLKILGCIGIVAATSGYGYSKGLEYQKQIEDTGELRCVILQLAQEIQYTCAPLAQVCEAVSVRSGRVYRIWLEHLSGELEREAYCRGMEEERTDKPGEKRRFADIWEEGCRKDLKSLALGKEESLRLYEIGMQLGSLNKNMEQQVFQQYAEFLEEKRARLLVGISEKRRICNLLGFTAGIFLLILIL